MAVQNYNGNTMNSKESSVVSGNTMLDRIAAGRTDLVHDYVAAGSHATSEGKVIQSCALYGDVSAIRFLLAHGETLEPLGPNLGLGNAVFFGHWRLCEFLLENGADVNSPLPDTGETPLHMALCGTHGPARELVVKVLIAAGADPNCTTKHSIATGTFMRDCKTKGETPLHRAAAFGSEATIQLLLDAGASLEAKDMNDDSPLSWASWYTRPDSILRKLCYGDHYVRPGRPLLEVELLGKPMA
jgi:uncharacterized protein